MLKTDFRRRSSRSSGGIWMAIVIGVLATTEFSAANAATNECRRLTMRHCDSGGSCKEVDVTICDPDTAVIREGGDAAEPSNGFVLRRSTAVPRSSVGGASRFSFPRKGASPQVCSLPTVGGALRIPTLPTVDVAESGGGPQKVKLVRVTVAQNLATANLTRWTDEAIAMLNMELSLSGVALRFALGNSSTVRPALELHLADIRGTGAASFYQYSGQNIAGMGSAEPLARSFISPVLGSDLVVAQQMLFAAGLRHNSSLSGGDSEPGRMALDRPGPWLTPCELGVLRSAFGSAGLAPKP